MCQRAFLAHLCNQQQQKNLPKYFILQTFFTLCLIETKNYFLRMPDVNEALGFTVLCPFAGCSGEPVDMHNSFLHCVLCGPLCVLCSVQVRFLCLESDMLAYS